MTSFYSVAISALDTPKSLLPFFVKDGFDNTGRTIMAAKQGGKHEARERFIEETGTSMFWIGGIPAVRWIANKVTKAKGNIDTDIHFKRINSDGIQNYFADKINISGKSKFSKKDLEGIILKSEKLDKIKQTLSQNKYIPNGSKGNYKIYHVGISAAAVLINLFMLTYALPKFNQFLSKNIISKEEKNKINAVKPEKNPEQIIKTNSKSQNNNNKVSFGSLKAFFDVKNLFNFTQMAESSQLNVTSSMLLLDYGISGSRVTFIPRNNDERIEYAVKEAGIILFFYYAADWIKKGFEAIANKAFKTPIDLDYKIINDKEFSNKLKNTNNNLFAFTQQEDELSIIKFIDKELSKAGKQSNKNLVFDNFTLNMAQKSGILDIEYDSQLQQWIRHSKKYIETEKLVELNKHLKNFYEKAIHKNGKGIDEIISLTKKVKAFSVVGNIAVCCVSLSFILPKIQYIIRKHRTKTNEAPGIKHYQTLAKENKI